MNISWHIPNNRFTFGQRLATIHDMTLRRFSVLIVSLFFLIRVRVAGYIYIENMTPVDARKDPACRRTWLLEVVQKNSTIIATGELKYFKVLKGLATETKNEELQ